MKVAICTPLYGDPAARYTNCLAQLIIYTMKTRPDIELEYVSAGGHLIPTRNTVAQSALRRGADFLLWIDGDTTFPAHSLLTLLGHNLAVVGCNCPTRVAPPMPTAFRNVEGRTEPVFPDAQKISSGAIEQIGSMGLAFCLISASVIQRLPEGPFRPHPRNPHGLGEDVKLFEDIKALGEGVFLDHALSQQIGHVTSIAFTLASVKDPRGKK